MKRFVTTILLVTYFLVSSGFAVNLHYCMNTFHSWELGEAEEDNCNKCGMTTEKSNGCCRDEIKVVKLQQELTPATAAIYHFSVPAIAPSPIPWLDVTFQDRAATYSYPIKGPPLLSKQDIYLNNCVFRL